MAVHTIVAYKPFLFTLVSHMVLRHLSTSKPETKTKPKTESKSSLRQWHSNDLLSTSSAAIYLGTTERFLELLRIRGSGPKFLRLSTKCIRYKFQHLSEWIDSKEKSSTSQP